MLLVSGISGRPPPPFRSPNVPCALTKVIQDSDIPSQGVSGMGIDPNQPLGSLSAPPHVGHNYYYVGGKLPPYYLPRVRHIFPV